MDPQEERGRLTQSPSHPPVLFLFSDTGGGHRASANAVARALAARPEPIASDIEDPFARGATPFIPRLTGLYAPLIRYAPPLWGTLYHASNSRVALGTIFGTLGSIVTPTIHRLLSERRPRVVVSVHPLLNHLTAQVAHQLSDPPALVTVITDMISFHRGWICPEMDALVVPNTEALGVSLRLGFPRSRSHVLGLPVDPRFDGPATAPARTRLRGALGLDPDLFTILITGGGEGAGPLLRFVEAITSSGLPVQLLVVAGRNNRLAEDAAAIPGLRGRVFGFVDNMPELMRASDAALCKAGPGTIAEALISGLPMALVSYLPGQEAGNVAYVTSNQAGGYTRRPAAALELVSQWVGSDGKPTAAHRRARRHCLELARPHASSEIAELIAGYVARG